MNANSKKQVGLLLIVVVMAAMLAFFAGSDVAQAKTTIVPPDDVYEGKTYDEWAATWWQWAAMIKADENHPLFADGTMDCGVGQTGDVWFLGGTYAESGVANRICDVPAGKALFFPVVNVLCSPFTGDDPDALIACAESPPVNKNFTFEMNPLSATIDGKKLGVNKLEDYYTLSEEVFDLGPLPFPNIFNAEDGAVGTGATSGYYLLLPPMEAGEHDIAFSGEIKVLNLRGKAVYHFETNISYELTVGE